MSVVCIIELKNQQGDYVECLEFIKAIEDKGIDNRMSLLEKAVLKLSIKVGDIRAGFSPRYMEEPMDVSDRGKKENTSVLNEHSFSDDDKYKLLSEKEKVIYHIRIHFNGQDDYDSYGEIIHLQYLAMLLKYIEPMLFEGGARKRLTVFMVPKTGIEFPYKDVEGNIDYDTYDFTSQYLRLLSKRFTGVIYGTKNENGKPVVTSLDFRKSKQNKIFFPLLLINSQKYSQLFLEPINDKIGELFSLKSNGRFRNAGNDNPNVAMQDYIAETDIKRIRSVVSIEGQEWKQSRQGIEKFLESCGDMCLIHFSLFSFMISKQKSAEKNDAHSYGNIWQVAQELSQGLRQIVQNALQHTQRKECFFAFYLHTRGEKEEKNAFQKRIATRFPEVVFKEQGRDEALEIIISDINEQEDMIDNFISNLEFEIEEQERILKGSFVLPGHEAIIKDRERLAIRNFFAEYEPNDPIQSWMKFRRGDLIAHIGLGQFAQTAERCNAAVKVISSKRSKVIDDKHIYYKSYGAKQLSSAAQMSSEKEIRVIPGTQFSILMPVGGVNEKRRLGISQLRQKNHVAENYSSFAEFLEYKEKRITVSVAESTTETGETSTVVLNAKRKYMLVQQWTGYWKEKFNKYFESQKENAISREVINYDFSSAVDIPYFADYDRIEVCLKGIIGALEVIREKNVGFYLAMTNLPDGFVDSFRRICTLLSVKEFPARLQLCLQENYKKDQSIKRVIMLGNDFSQAISNSYVLSLEQGVNGFDKNDCKRAAKLKTFLTPECIWKESLLEKESIVGAMPFDVILKCGKDDSRFLFERQLKDMAEGTLDEKIAGYKLNDTHMRLGSKVHIESFYEMSFLFYRTTIANRLAFMILRDLLEMSEEKIDLLDDSILFYGYASYSKAILTSITEILQEYRVIKKAGMEHYVAFASFQHNLMLESEETQMYFGLQHNNFLGEVDENNHLSLKNNTKIIQIVPISSTLTTFEKMWRKFMDSVSNETRHKISLQVNYTVFWVVDDGGNVEQGLPSGIEEKYWSKVTGREIETKLILLKKAEKQCIHFFMRSAVTWHDPLKCKLCYPEHVIDEVPLVETDLTSTVPTQQIRYKDSSLPKKEVVEDSFCERFVELEDCISYDHICRRQNHYQFYIDTQRYFYKVKSGVKSWLENIDNDLEKEGGDPILHIIFSPEHNTNVGFAQYVNTYYFKGLAEIVSINVDKQFRSNFVCEHAALKQMVDELYQDNGEEEECPIRFYFVDDTIITGETFQKANGLLQSLVPSSVFSTNLFSKIFLLIDRLSSDTKQAYVSNTEDNFLSFLHIDVSNTRTHGDSCIGCKLEQDVKKMFKRSATRNMAHYWSTKITTYRKKEYDNRNKIAMINKQKSYCMLVFSHVIQNIIIKQGRYSKQGDAYDVVTNIACWLLSDEMDARGNAFGFEKLLKYNKGIYGVQALFKTICRPYISYDFGIKRQFFTFFILLAELFMQTKEEEIIPEYLEGKKGHISFMFEKDRIRIKSTKELVESIKKKLDEQNMSRLDFLDKYIFEGLTDMGSNYIMRKQTLQKTYFYVKNTKNDFLQEDQMAFWCAYEVNLHRLISNNSDETKELWLEYLYMTGMEYREFASKYENAKEKTFEPRFLYTEITKNSEVKEEDKCFYQFCHNLFFQNIGINFDNLEERIARTKGIDKSDGKYFKEYWRQMYCLSQFENPFENQEEGLTYNIEKEETLFKFLWAQDNKHNHVAVKMVDKWYKELLKNIKDVVSGKYHVKNINIALLTKTINEEDNGDIQSMHIVEADLDFYESKLAETKYRIKKRVLEAKNNEKVFSLEKNGYFLEEDLKHYEIQRPYAIVLFDNPKAKVKVNEVNTEYVIAPVFLYISIEKQEPKERTQFILRLILREVITYRNRIVRCLQKDFAGDLYARYTRKNGEQNIVSHEKAHSHNTTGDDLITLEIFQDKDIFKKGYKKIGMEQAKDWLLLRNYTNGQIAKLFNRSFHDFQEEKGEKTDSPMLYIPQNVPNSDYNPFKCKLERFSNLNLKNKSGNPWDKRFELLNEIIQFRYDEELEEAAFIQDIDGQYYNLEYFRCIVIDMFISAMKYETSGADFLLRIDRLLEVNDTLKTYNQPEYLQVGEDKELEELRNRLKGERCIVDMYREKSPYEGIDYLIIRNPVNTWVHRIGNWEKGNESIEHRLQDPLDFADGHMSLLTIKRYIEKLNIGKKVECVFHYQCEKDDKGEKHYYFENCLPVLKNNWRAGDETDLLD